MPRKICLTKKSSRILKTGSPGYIGSGERERDGVKVNMFKCMYYILIVITVKSQGYQVFKRTDYFSIFEFN